MRSVLIGVLIMVLIMAASYIALFFIWRPKTIVAKITLIGMASILPVGLWSLTDFALSIIAGAPSAKDFVFAAVCLVCAYSDYRMIQRETEVPSEL